MRFLAGSEAKNTLKDVPEPLGTVAKTVRLRSSGYFYVQGPVHIAIAVLGTSALARKPASSIRTYSALAEYKLWNGAKLRPPKMVTSVS